MEPNNSIKLREKRDFGQIINATFSFWKENLKPLSKSIIMIVGPAILIGILFMVYFMSEFFTSIDFQNPNQNPQRV